MMSHSESPAIHPNLQTVSWLLGKWKSESGQGKYPTIEPFEYEEEMEFTHVGQPSLQYSAFSRNIDSKKPMHREVGFLKIEPNKNKVALVLAHNIGTCEIEEGVLDGKSMSLESNTFGRVSFNKPPTVTKVQRVFKCEGDTLTQILSMETERTPMTEHLRAVYKKIN